LVSLARQSEVRAGWLCLALLVLAGCSDPGGLWGDTAQPDAGVTAPLGRSLPVLCGRQAADRVARLFCGETAPEIAGLEDFAAQLGLRPDDGLLIGHSTALGGHLVSAANPRVLRMPGFELDASLVVIAFTRGQQRVELLALDPTTERMNLYLVEFEQRCNGEAEGCSAGDLFGPAIEEGWLELRIRDDEDLKNTPSDCRRCHGGSAGMPGPVLLMRELEVPWMHWFRERSPLIEDYRQAHLEPHTGVVEAIGGLSPGGVHNPDRMENLVGLLERAGLQGPQPLLFPSAVVGFETGEIDSATGLPSESGPAHVSPTWAGIYDAFRQGQLPAPPFRHERVTHVDGLKRFAESYRAMLAGEIATEALISPREVFPDDPQLRAEIGLEVEPDAGGVEALLQACASCHNARLDPTLSRARFDVDLARVDRSTLARAIERIQLPADDPAVMPPREARQLTAPTRLRLLEFLEQQLAAQP